MYVCMYLSIYLCIYVSMYLSIYVYMYLCIYVSMYLCIYVSMYLCIYVATAQRVVVFDPLNHNCCRIERLDPSSLLMVPSPVYPFGVSNAGFSQCLGRLKSIFDKTPCVDMSS